MLGLLKFPDDFQKSKGLNQLWFKDNGTDASIAGNNRNDRFAFRQIYVIQKRHLFIQNFSSFSRNTSLGFVMTMIKSFTVLNINSLS